MIGFYDYTVILTYLSLISGMLGVIICLHGIGHPFIGIFFLMFSGLCDTFDGRVARSKKNRTLREQIYGVQIDSLADLVAFGVLPPCIGMAMLRGSHRFTDRPHVFLQGEGDRRILYPILLMLLCCLYVLAALIRLAYFNMLEEEERLAGGKDAPRGFVGLPVTSASLIFPTVMLVHFLTRADLTLLYFGVMFVTGVLFISPFRMAKPRLRQIAVLLLIGAVEFILLLLIHHFWRRP